MGQRLFCCPLWTTAGKDNMARYFMNGTRYEDFERMMMSPDRRGKDEDIGNDPTNNCTHNHMPHTEVEE